MSTMMVPARPDKQQQSNSMLPAERVQQWAGTWQYLHQ